jgi:uncharacterized protein (DUF2126 family)
MRRIKVALKLPKGDLAVIAKAKHIASCMTGNAYVPAVTCAASARDQKLRVVLDDLEQLRVYVETVANTHGPDAKAVIVSCGMHVKQSAGPSKALFDVKQGKTSGSVRLLALHPGIRASFGWQYSVDGEQWVDAGETSAAELERGGFTPGTEYWFRFSTLTTHGRSDWSDPLKLLVT